MTKEQLRKSWRRSFAIALTAAMVVNSAVPGTVAYAAEFTAPDESIQTLSGNETENANTQAQDKSTVFGDGKESTGDIFSTGTENASSAQTSEKELSEAVKTLQERINALPFVEEFQTMVDSTTVEDSTLNQKQTDVYNEAQAIVDKLNQLSEEEQGQVDTSRLEALFEYFNRMTAVTSSMENPIVVPYTAYICKNGALKGISKTWYDEVCPNGETCYIRLVIPAQINGTDITSISNDSFRDRGNGFQDKACVDLSKIKIVSADFENASNLQEIQDYAFDQRSELGGSIDLSKTKITSIGAGAFRGTSITDVILTDTVQALGDTNTGAGTFAQCPQLKSVKYASYTGSRVVALPDSLITIGKQCFRYSFPKEMSFAVDIPASVSSIGAEAFNTNNNDGTSRFSSIYVKRTEEYSGYDKYAFQNGKSFIIFPGAESYKAAIKSIDQSSIYAPTYELDTVFKEAGKTDMAASQRKLYNQYIYYEKNTEDVWTINDDYSLPDLPGTTLKPGYEISWYFENNKKTVSSSSKMYDGSITPSTINILTSGIKISDPQVTVSGPQYVCEGSDITLKMNIRNKVDGLHYEYAWGKWNGSEWDELEGENKDTLTVTKGGTYYLGAVEAYDDDGNRSEQTGAYMSVYQRTHTWEYKSEKNQITVKCQNSGCKYEADGVTSVLNAEDMAYTGEAYDKASFGTEVTDLTGISVGAITYYAKGSEEPLTAAPVEPGEYKATVTIDKATAEKTFFIRKEIKPIVHISDWTYGDYDETVNKPVLEEGSNPGNGEVTYTYYQDVDCKIETTVANGAETSGAVPANAGTYYVKAHIAATGDYESGEAITSFVIKKAESVFQKPEAISGLIYSGEVQELVHAGQTADGKFIYKINDGEWSENLPFGLDAGIYEIFYKVVGDNNHNDSEEGKLTVTIVKKETAADYPVTGVTVSSDKTILTKEGETTQITATVTPSYADNKNVTWKSSDEKVATVDKNGKVTAVGNGTATITATTADGKYSATTTITVKIAPEKLTLTAEKTTLTKIGDSLQITAKVEPDNAYKKLIWKSSDEKVAIVDADGKVTAVGTGTATITATTEDGKLTESVTITVKIPDEPTVNETTGYGRLKARSVTQTNNSIKLEWTRVSGADGYIIYGNYCNGNGKVYKYNKITTITNGKTRTWTHTKLKKATYYKYIVKAYKLVNGKKVITDTSVSVHATTTGGKYGVAKAVSITKIGNKKNVTKVTLKKGKTAQITAKEIKKDRPIRHHRNICYESSNTKVAAVTPDGVIQATGKGTCTIWVYAQNGVYKAIVVTVK